MTITPRQITRIAKSAVINRTAIILTERPDSSPVLSAGMLAAHDLYSTEIVTADELAAAYTTHGTPGAVALATDWVNAAFVH